MQHQDQFQAAPVPNGDVVARHALRRVAFLRSELELEEVATCERLRGVCERELSALTLAFPPRPLGL